MVVRLCCRCVCVLIEWDFICFAGALLFQAVRFFIGVDIDTIILIKLVLLSAPRITDQATYY